MSPQKVREVLMTRATELIANEGLDRTTTRALVTGTGINEVNIYRRFSGKEDLLTQTFEQLDEQLLAVAEKNLPVMDMRGIDIELRCRICFATVWKFLLSNREKCLAYVRYYYSPYYEKQLLAGHRTRFEPMVKSLRRFFKENTDIYVLLDHVLSVMLNFASKVHNQQVADTEACAELVFNMLFSSVGPYFKQSEEQNG